MTESIASQKPAAQKATYDVYGPIHKGLRFALSKLLLRLGSADWADEAGTRKLLADLRAQIQICEDHMKQEEGFYHVKLEERVPGGSKLLVEHHNEHRASFTGMEALIRQTEAAEAGKRAASGHALYLKFSSFVAEDFSHMHHEETVILPQFQAHFTDDELREMEHGLVSTIEPDKFMVIMQMLLPGMSPAERAAEMTLLKDNAPAEDFNAVMEHAARAMLSEADYADLCARIGVKA